jgi:ribA/ribD-fused uncharacterized protein
MTSKSSTLRNEEVHSKFSSINNTEVKESSRQYISPNKNQSAINKKYPGQSVIGFHGSIPLYKEFSNFHPTEFLLAGVKYSSSEMAFQAEKFNYDSKEAQDIRKQILALNTPGKCLRLAKAYGDLKHKDWYNGQRIEAMRLVIAAKFTQDEKLKNLLLSTGNTVLVEDSPNDDYWGIHNQENGSPGENKLGELLMELRSKLKEEQIKDSKLIQSEPKPTN